MNRRGEGQPGYNPGAQHNVHQPMQGHIPAGYMQPPQFRQQYPPQAPYGQPQPQGYPQSYPHPNFEQQPPHKNERGSTKKWVIAGVGALAAVGITAGIFAAKGGENGGIGGGASTSRELLVGAECLNRPDIYGDPKYGLDFGVDDAALSSDTITDEEILGHFTLPDYVTGSRNNAPDIAVDSLSSEQQQQLIGVARKYIEQMQAAGFNGGVGAILDSARVVQYGPVSLDEHASDGQVDSDKINFCIG